MTGVQTDPKWSSSHPKLSRIDYFYLVVQHAGARTLQIRKILSGTAGHPQDHGVAGGAGRGDSAVPAAARRRPANPVNLDDPLRAGT